MSEPPAARSPAPAASPAPSASPAPAAISGQPGEQSAAVREQQARQNRVYICLGSNLQAEQRLPAAVQLLRQSGTVTAASRVYETLPVGDIHQPNFLNAAVLLETELLLNDILDIAQQIELALGRQRDPGHPSGPRTIDLDVVLFNREIIQKERREIPDPDILKYAFVAVPLAELDPLYRHPLNGRTLADIAAERPIAAGDMRVRADVTLL